MAFFSRKKPLVGLDIGSSSVKAVELVRTRNGYEITGFDHRESHGCGGRRP
jgi:Tfp pilus assembly PilM family ATPase